jgi:carbon monoxide dehydrogenase subunit G
MLEFENTLHIDRPLTKVFAFLADFENIPKWNYYVLNVRKLTAGPIGIGTTYHQVRKTDEQDFRVIDFEPDHQVTVRTVPPSSLVFERRLTLADEGGSTRLRDEWKLETGWPGLLEKLAAGGIKSAVAANLAKLKELLEAGQMVLPDGRPVTRP